MVQTTDEPPPQPVKGRLFPNHSSTRARLWQDSQRFQSVQPFLPSPALKLAYKFLPGLGNARSSEGRRKRPGWVELDASSCRRDPTIYWDPRLIVERDKIASRPGRQPMRMWFCLVSKRVYQILLNSAATLSRIAGQTFSRTRMGGWWFLTHPSIPWKVRPDSPLAEISCFSLPECS